MRAVACPIACSCMPYRLQLHALSLAVACPIACSCMPYRLLLHALSLAVACPIACSCMPYRLQLHALSLAVACRGKLACVVPCYLCAVQKRRRHCVSVPATPKSLSRSVPTTAAATGDCWRRYTEHLHACACACARAQCANGIWSVTVAAKPRSMGVPPKAAVLEQANDASRY
jgi:hypothetical protein